MLSDAKRCLYILLITHPLKCALFLLCFSDHVFSNLIIKFWPKKLPRFSDPNRCCLAVGHSLVGHKSDKSAAGQNGFPDPRWALPDLFIDFCQISSCCQGFYFVIFVGVSMLDKTWFPIFSLFRHHVPQGHIASKDTVISDCAIGHLKLP